MNVGGARLVTGADDDPATVAPAAGVNVATTECDPAEV